MIHEECEILIVEDNPEDAELMLRSLKKMHLANQVIHLEDGAEALDFILNQGAYAQRKNFIAPRVMLLDLKRPKVHGLEVLKEIKSNPGTRNIPVVIITSSREDPDIKKAYELGANSYIVKPIDFKDFMDTLSHIGFYWMVVNERPN